MNAKNLDGSNLSHHSLNETINQHKNISKSIKSIIKPNPEDLKEDSDEEKLGL